ncbi:MAG TPA: CoA transferase [Burkholderiales bacterium]|nr:CoA transferase [Burkholderiales bacterium]
MSLQAAAGNGPLAGYRVLELGSTAAGPFCARLLADFGAQVVKIESPDGDPIRQLGETVDGKSLYAASICRNKTIAALDLRKPEARQLVKKLVAQFDVVVENFRPGTLEKWGLGYEELARLRPGLVMTRISGFGQTGPYRGRPGYGVIGEAMSGLRHMIGDPDRPPSRAAVPLTDYITALYAAFGTVMAVLFREKTGIGQCIDASLLESAFSFMEVLVPTYEKTGKIGMRAGSRLPNSAPNNLYATRDARHIHIAALADPVYRRLAEAMGQPELASDPRFAEQTIRAENAGLLDELVTRWTTSHDLAELERILDAAEVPASRVFTMEDIFGDPHYRARDMLPSVPDDDLGSVVLAGVVPKLSATPGAIRWSGHRTGQDTRAVLKELAGLSEAEIDDLARAGIVFCDQQPGAAAARPGARASL